MDSIVKEALLWKKLPEGKVMCRACNRFCVIEDGWTGFCGVRKNDNGKLFSLVYGRTLTLSIDPIEKKPLFHFKPGSKCLGISTFGCNFSCLQCQNNSLSQERRESEILKVPITSPREIVERTIDAGAQGIAYTYNEPTVFLEYALDTMKLAKKKGLYNVWVSNGYMSSETARLVAPFLNAINIDLKGNEKFYREVCGKVERRFVLDNIRLFHKKGVHVEVANLVIPSCNDSEKDFKEVSEFIASVDKNIPLHFTGFFPQYKLDYLPAANRASLVKARDIAKKSGLDYVYLGNLGGEEDSFCKSCGSTLVKRMFYATEIVGFKGNEKKVECSKCGEKNDFIL